MTSLHLRHKALHGVAQRPVKYVRHEAVKQCHERVVESHESMLDDEAFSSTASIYLYSYE